jgi:hypothetical protein
VDIHIISQAGCGKKDSHGRVGDEILGNTLEIGSGPTVEKEAIFAESNGVRANEQILGKFMRQDRRSARGAHLAAEQTVLLAEPTGHLEVRDLGEEVTQQREERRMVDRSRMQ